MSTHSQAHYIKIGVFVIVGLVLLMVCVFILGARVFKKPAFIAETYINESVQGIRVGATLQARGVPFGHVKSIEFVNAIYGDQIDTNNVDAVHASHYVRLILAFDSIPHAGKGIPFEQQVEAGLRVRIVSQGITGLSALDLDFFDVKERNDLPIFWKPQYPYIPAVPSTMTRISKSLDQVIDYIQHVDITGTFSNVNATLLSIQAAVENLHTGTMAHNITNLIDKISILADSANKILSDDELQATLTELPLALKSVRTQIDTEIPKTLDAFRTLAQTEVPKTLDAIQQTSAAATDLLRNNAPVLLDLTPQLQTLLQNLNDLTLKLKDQPSLLLFSGPQDDGAQ